MRNVYEGAFVDSPLFRHLLYAHPISCRQQTRRPRNRQIGIVAQIARHRFVGTSHPSTPQHLIALANTLAQKLGSITDC